VAFRQSTNVFPFVLLLTAALALFWLRTPLESLLGISAMRTETKEERSSVAFVVLYLAIVAILASSMLLWSGHNSLLWAIGAAAGFAFVAQAVLRKMGRATRMLSEIVGTIGLTASAPAVYYVITGKFGITGWMLWLANLMFAGNQIHYVQIRIHTSKLIGLRAARALPDLRAGTIRDGSGAGGHVRARLDALARAAGFYSSAAARLLLLRPETCAAASAPLRLERVGAGDRLLRAFHRALLTLSF
jgi:hypothetical protein